MSLTNKLKERKSMKKFKSLDEKYMGLEPTWEDVDENTPDVELNNKIQHALRWYQHFHDFKTSVGHIHMYFKKHKTDRTNLKKLSLTHDIIEVGRTPGFLCRMLMKGLPRLSANYQALLVQKLKRIEEIGKYRESIQEKQKDNPNVISIQERIQQIADSLIFDIDYIIDVFQENDYNTTFTFEAFAEVNQIKKPTAQKLIPLLQERIDELENKDEDPDLKEAYRHLKKREKNKIIKVYNECVKGCEKIIVTSQRKKRKKVK